MSQVVWKYELPMYEDTFFLKLPRYAKPLHFAVQHGAPCLWVLVDPEEDVEPRLFRFAGTGHELGRPGAGCRWDHIGTVFEQDGALVWHLFVEKRFQILREDESSS